MKKSRSGRSNPPSEIEIDQDAEDKDDQEDDRNLQVFFVVGHVFHLVS
jgi:hypothetical protein